MKKDVNINNTYKNSQTEMNCKKSVQSVPLVMLENGLRPSCTFRLLLGTISPTKLSKHDNELMQQT